MANRIFRLAKLAIAASPLLLGGCGLPPVVVAFSYAMDGLSYASSGKSVTDHALSAAAARDCAMFRMVQGRDICRDDAPGDGASRLASAGGPGRTAGKALAPAAGDSRLISPNQMPVRLAAGEGRGITARLINFPAATEVYALLQDDGVLEIFAYGGASAGGAGMLSLIATYENFAKNPVAFKGVAIGGSFHAIGDLIV